MYDYPEDECYYCGEKYYQMQGMSHTCNCEQKQKAERKDRNKKTTIEILKEEIKNGRESIEEIKKQLEKKEEWLDKIIKLTNK